MKIFKWLFGAFAFVVGLIIIFFTLSTYNEPNLDDFIEYETLNSSYKIPYEFVVPGTLPGIIPKKEYDIESPDIFIWFKGEYINKHISSFEIRTGKNKKYFHNLHVSLSDVSEDEAVRLWGLNQRFEAVTLSGDFENGYVEYIEESGLYRVFREYQGEKLDGFWDLVSIDPSINNARSESYNGIWLASCHKVTGDNGTNCAYVVDILGMYSKISATEDDFKRLDAIKSFIASHLKRWETPTMLQKN